VNHLKKEIVERAPVIGPRPLDTVYFGGGTPSLLEPEMLGAIVNSFKEAGFTTNSNTEVTLEINPATLDDTKLQKLMDFGFNRFSVGVQTFNERLLELCKRKHSAQDTLNTLNLLEKYQLNYSVDILFALPHQSLGDLKEDLRILNDFNFKHSSPYCLTVPEGHPMSLQRPQDEVQVEMFSVIEEALNKKGLERYEISNFAIPGFESRHNLLYWTNEEYWGVGLSAHSYMKRAPWGTRFWNARQLAAYFDDLKKPFDLKNNKNGEWLSQAQAMTDYCHTALRMSSGLSEKRFFDLFQTPLKELKSREIYKLLEGGLVSNENNKIRLTSKGLLLSNQVFLDFVFEDSSLTRQSSVSYS
jgi:oxygen-independent coproporphyrinogen-3 oxidase